jgi:hypothetical protein
MSEFPLWLVLVLLLTASKVTLAQITFDGCKDFRGIPVASVSDANVPDVAMATYAYTGEPIIIYNPNVLVSLSPPTRLFFYAHECAHHALGHGVQGHPLTREQEADCWGIRLLVGKSLLSDLDVTAIQLDIANLGRGDWTHLPGPYRAINIRACLMG